MSRTSAPSFAQLRRGAAGRDHLDAVPRKAGRELVEPGLVGKRNQRPANGNEVGHRHSFSISWCGGTASRFRRPCRNFADDDQLRRAAAAARGRRSTGFPRSSALPPRQRKFHGGAPRRAQDRAHPVGGRWSPRPRARGGSGPRRRPNSRIFLRPLAISWSAPRSSLPSLPSIRLRLWIRPKRADIAVVARLEPARVIVLAAVDGRPPRRPCRASRRRGSRSNWCRRAPACCARRWCAGPATSSSGKLGRKRSRAAAIDDQPLGAVATFRTPASRREPCSAIFCGGGGAASSTRIVPSADSR